MGLHAHAFAVTDEWENNWLGCISKKSVDYTCRAPLFPSKQFWTEMYACAV